MIPRHTLEAIFRGVVAECRPEDPVRANVRKRPLGPVTYGLALGDAALSMVRGAGPVLHGIAITRDDDPLKLPHGWAAMPPDETSELQILDVLASATADSELLLLLSGGAEEIITPALASGRLAQLASAPIRTLVASNLAGDNLDLILGAPTGPTTHERATVVVQRDAITSALWRELRRYFPTSENIGAIVDTVPRLAAQIARESRSYLWPHYWFGKPAEAEPGSAQLMALHLAHALRGTDLSAFCVASTGWDGPAIAGHPRPAGACVDGSTWDQMVKDRLDPASALARREPGPVLRATGALVVTHFTGIDHGGDLVIVG